MGAASGMVRVAKARYWQGSSAEEREQAYQDYRSTAGHESARRGKWFDRELPLRRVELQRYRLDPVLVTNAMYAEFLADTGCPVPSIDEEAWAAQRFIQDFEKDVVPKNWSSSTPPAGRDDHPVVLVTHEEATQYCRWRGERAGTATRLPSEGEFTRAARGDENAGEWRYPWGDDFDASKLNSHVSGPLDTTPVRRYPPNDLGLYDMAGNVFQWTSTPWGDSGERFTVKGSAWDDWAGLGRAAARHGRRRWIRHVIVGFRCAADLSAEPSLP